MFNPKTEKIKEEILSPWITLISKTYDSPQGEQTYHSFKQRDYIVTLALTTEGEIPMVRQYRPAVGQVTLELPAGLGEEGELPAITAQRELFEETGYSSDRKLQFLGKFAADTGRLTNDIYFYFVDRAFRSASIEWKPEPGIEVLLMTKQDLKESLLSAQLSHSMHLAAIALAQVYGLFDWK